jgi:hypothetical protein
MCTLLVEFFDTSQVNVKMYEKVFNSADLPDVTSLNSYTGGLPKK